MIFYTPASRHSLAHDPENATEYDPDPIAFSSHALLQLCLLLLKYHRACILTSDSSKPITGDNRISQHLSRFSTFARHSDRDARNRSQLCHCFAAALKGAMPFAPAQARSYDLTSTLVAMDTITTVEACREQALSPTFVNIVGDGRCHASPPQAAMRGISGLDALNAVTDCW